MRLARPGRSGLVAIGAALALSAMPAVALGHVSLTSSTPRAGDNVEVAPEEVRLTFDGELDPMGSGFTVHDQDGKEVGSGGVDLEVADRNVLSGGVDIAEPGVYTVEWTVLGADGHEISGAYAFGYATGREIPAAGNDGHESPDTAMRQASPNAVVLAGIAVLALAGLGAGRRFAVAPLAFALPLILAACVPAGNVPDDCRAEAVVRRATLVDERLEPATLEVCRGQDVTLDLVMERDAIFHIHGYDTEVPARQLEAGSTVSIAFQAVRAGQFLIAIHTTDGPAEATVGTLIVHEG